MLVRQREHQIWGHSLQPRGVEKAPARRHTRGWPAISVHRRQLAVGEQGGWLAFREHDGERGAEVREHDGERGAEVREHDGERRAVEARVTRPPQGLGWRQVSEAEDGRPGRWG